MGSGRTVAVFGAYGHTGRFVVAELRKRGFVPVLSGRDAGKLEAMAEPGLDARPASVDDPASEWPFPEPMGPRAVVGERRAVATGQDLYAITAPLAVEAVDRILTGRTSTTGVASAGEIFDAADFLRALSPHISVELCP